MIRQQSFNRTIGHFDREYDTTWFGKIFHNLVWEECKEMFRNHQFIRDDAFFLNNGVGNRKTLSKMRRLKGTLGIQR